MGADALTALSLVFQALTVALYAVLCVVVKRRRVSGDVRAANASFALWWGCLGLATALPAAQVVLFLSGVREDYIHRGIALAAILPLIVGLWGLLYYLLYVYTGWRGWAWPLAAFYFGVFALFFIVESAVDPGLFQLKAGQVVAGAQNQLHGALVWSAVALLLGPIIVAAIAYGTLAFRLEEKPKRQRVAVTSLAIVFWFASPFLAIPIAGNEVASVLLMRSIALAFPLMILLAHLREAGARVLGWPRRVSAHG